MYTPLKYFVEKYVPSSNDVGENLKLLANLPR